jgi:tetratricopeptide (TPR) repeat protein
MKWIVLLLPALAFAQSGEITASKDAMYRRANESYMSGRYQEAVDTYEQVVALGVHSEDLYYNLANAYLKAGKLGPAMYNYERALELDPGQDDVQWNLKAAREVARKIGEDRLVGAEGVPFWQRIVTPYTISLLGWIFLGLYLAVFGALIALRFIPQGFLRVGVWVGFAFLSVGALIGGAMLGARLYLATRVEQAIVLPDQAQVKEGPDQHYTTSFTVHAGLRVRVTEKDQDWVRVRLSNGLEGWLRERDIGRL